MSDKTSCARVREWVVDAAAGSLPERRRVEFDAHVSQCAGCREEFQRAKMLLRAIDEGVRASVAVEPSPHLAVSVRQAIAAQGQRAAQWWRQRNVWLTATGACAALALLLFASGVLHKFNRPVTGLGRSPIVAATPSRAAAAKESAGVESATRAERRKPANIQRRELALARQRALRSVRRHAEPEIIVQPGQMQAILQFVAEVQEGKINGAEIEAGIKASEKPLEIKPLVIPPLKVPESVSAAAAAVAASNSEQKFTSDEPN